MSGAGLNRQKLDALLRKLWEEYVRLNPSLLAIHDKIFEREERRIVNDHIALRGFAINGLGIAALAADFLHLGYEEAGEYEFTAKKLSAKHLEHPDPGLPKIFISELNVEECSPLLRETLGSILATTKREPSTPLCLSGRPWRVTKQQYLSLLEESEYAAWTSAFGFRANHHTVSVNDLRTFDSLGEVNDFVRSLGYSLNDTDGDIKGSPEDYLEQSSTLAEMVSINFDDETEACIPGCFYEFAKRYHLHGGALFQGFVTKSAERIFDSTNAERPR